MVTKKLISQLNFDFDPKKSKLIFNQLLMIHKAAVLAPSVQRENPPIQIKHYALCKLRLTAAPPSGGFYMYTPSKQMCTPSKQMYTPSNVHSV